MFSSEFCDIFKNIFFKAPPPPPPPPLQPAENLEIIIKTQGFLIISGGIEVD